jgi:hypothetical protein
VQQLRPVEDPDGAALPPLGLAAREKYILVKHAGGWRIIQHQQTLVVPDN